MSTISPQITKELAAEAKEKGLFWLDAPVSGGQKGAIEGTLTIMVGGEAEALEKARPVLAAMGKRISHFGASGNGQNAKLANQICGEKKKKERTTKELCLSYFVLFKKH
jgi:3-hydroxyisobutyrate dehydrogenase-like beta-hydroxyacid dehydrogenase